MIRGDRGVTYSAALPEDTTLTAGTWWEPDSAGPPLVSFAAEEAEEMGLQLGDTLTVNILGRDITATITSFREVDFSTAGIGFILSMNPAALAGAPHSFISTVYADEAAEAENADYTIATGVVVMTGNVLLTPLVLLASLLLDRKRTVHDLLLGTVVTRSDF